MLDMVVAGTEDAVLMVESEANELSEDIMLGSVLVWAPRDAKSNQGLLRSYVQRLIQLPGNSTEDTVTAEFTSNVAESFTADIAAAFKSSR